MAKRFLDSDGQYVDEDNTFIAVGQHKMYRMYANKTYNLKFELPVGSPMPDVFLILSGPAAATVTLTISVDAFSSDGDAFNAESHNWTTAALTVDDNGAWTPYWYNLSNQLEGNVSGGSQCSFDVHVDAVGGGTAYVAMWGIVKEE